MIISRLIRHQPTRAVRLRIARRRGSGDVQVVRQNWKALRLEIEGGFSVPVCPLSRKRPGETARLRHTSGTRNGGGKQICAVFWSLRH